MTFDDLIAYYGTPKQAADRLGYTRQAVTGWRRRKIPEKAQRLIQAATRGRLRADAK